MKQLFRRLRLPHWPEKNTRVYTVGICAMDKKARSKQMNHIIERLRAYGEFEIVMFGDVVILHSPIEEWPKVECLLAWHSDGFPLAKVQAYARLRRPFLVNDVVMQDVLLHRLSVYQTLVAHNIPVPNHIIVDRAGLLPGQDPPGFVEAEEYVELGGRRIAKPFVEKPGDAEDHNIWIYYPLAQGGGVKKLFRKVDNKSSSYEAGHSGRVRRDGSYIYEEFLATGGTDVKVYTVGPSYAHAEARKSPVVDGKVLRTSDGKEMRFPVLLTPAEKEVARAVVAAFKQNVCGFDLLRSDKGVSYVCDVNGWSFVKNSRRYYDDTAGILRSILIGGVDPMRLAAAPEPLVSFTGMSGPTSMFGPHGSGLAGLAEDDAALLEAEPDDDLLVGVEGEVERTDARTQADELRCVLAVIRHGDRTPKQKLKIKVTAEPLLALFHKHKDGKGKQAKLKTPGQLQELLDITRDLLGALERIEDAAELPALLAPPAALLLAQSPHALQPVPELSSSSEASTATTATTAATSTTNTTLTSTSSSSTALGSMMAAAAVAAAAAMTADDRAAALELREKLRIVKTVLEQASFNGINRKVQLKPSKWRLVPGNGSATPSGGSGNNSTMAAGGLPRGAPSFSTHNLLLPSDSHVPAPVGLDGNKRLQSFSAASFSAGALPAPAAGASEGAATSPSPPPQQQLVPVLEEALMVVKWGGVLTHAGRQQAEDLGKQFRMIMYPRYGSAGGGLLRLHSTYRHDLKIYSSDEGRVQASAAAFAKGLLDLEGTSLTPILVSLVKKDASMLEAFGKGASDDIHAAKAAVYQLMTAKEGADKGGSGTPALLPSTPPMSPPHSVVPPTPAQRSSPGAAETAAAAGAAAPPVPASVPSAAPSAQPSPRIIGGLTSAHNSGGLAVPPALLQMRESGGSMARGWGPGGAGVGKVKGMPEAPLTLLRRLVELMKALVAQLRELCLQERVSAAASKRTTDNAGHAPDGARPAGVGARFSSVSHEPAEWFLEPGQPCSGERMLLMFDRWAKLHKSFYSEKKDTFDISKIPDIYDSAKYDAIHNNHLLVGKEPPGVLKELYLVSKQLADAVIPNEYGIDPSSKLRIGSTIAGELLGKLLVDLAAMREESITTPAVDGPLTGPLSTLPLPINAHRALAVSTDGGRGRRSGSAASLAGSSVATPSKLSQVGGPGPLAAASGGVGVSTPPGSEAGSSLASHDASGGPGALVHAVKEAAHEVAEAMKERAVEAKRVVAREVHDVAANVKAAAAAALDKIGRHVGSGSQDGGSSTRSGGGATPAGVDGSGASVATLAPSDQPPPSHPTDDDRSISFASIVVEGGTAVASADGTRTPTDDPAGAAAAAAATSDASVFKNNGGGSGAGSDGGEEGEGGGEGDAEGKPGGGDGDNTEQEVEPEMIHRLAPEYAPHINSPLRHVRTRIYFTSESHIHSLVNVLRHCHLWGGGAATRGSSTTSVAGAETLGAPPVDGVPGTGADGAGASAPQPLLSPQACDLLDATTELDYLTHIVLRMYENKSVPVTAPERFRVEIMFSPGASHHLFDYFDAWEAAGRPGGAQPGGPHRHNDARPSDTSMSATPTPALSTATSGVLPATAAGVEAERVSGVSHPAAPPRTPPRQSMDGGDGGTRGGAKASPDAAAAVAVAAAAEAQQQAQDARRSGYPSRGCRGPAWHTLPVRPRQQLHEGEGGATLIQLEDALLPMAKVHKFAPPSYVTYLSQRAQARGIAVSAHGGAPGAAASRLHSRYSSAMNVRDAGHISKQPSMRVTAEQPLAAPAGISGSSGSGEHIV